MTMRLEIICTLFFFAIRILWKARLVSSFSTTPFASNEMQPNPSGTTDDDKEVKIMGLQNLLDDFGALRHCEIGMTKKNGRGLIATKDLKPGEIALQVPLRFVLRESDDDKNSIKNQIDGHEEDNWAGRLAKRLIANNESLNSNFYAQNVLPLLEPPMTPSRGDWPEWILDEFDNNENFEIKMAQDWRYHQWKKHCNQCEDRQSYLDALDMVCSRTMRCGNNMMLVPLLDMANHASQAEGGGYYQLASLDDKNKISNDNTIIGNDKNENISLIVGERGVKMGEEVTLNYGHRSNEDWIIHYGFLPYRNEDSESVQLPTSGRVVTWKDVRTNDPTLREECIEYLSTRKTLLEEDLILLRGNKIEDNRYRMAVQYRSSRKILLNAVIGNTSYF